MYQYNYAKSIIELYGMSIESVEVYDSRSIVRRHGIQSEYLIVKYGDFEITNLSPTGYLHIVTVEKSLNSIINFHKANREFLKRKFNITIDYEDDRDMSFDEFFRWIQGYKVRVKNG